MMIPRPVRPALFVGVLVAAAILTACSSYDKNAITVIAECTNGPGNPSGCNTPTFADFMPAGDDNNKIVGVGDFMIQRCGSLDCHGQVGRPLRLYGKDALRLADAGTGGTAPSTLNNTTPQEYQADFDTIVALQPEDMARVMTGIQDPNTLLLLLKPTNSLVHKGGPVIFASPPDYGFLCLVDWLTYDKFDAAGTAGNCPKAKISFP
jgi:hypothetical protein